jgi:hypothetical protein
MIFKNVHAQPNKQLSLDIAYTDISSALFLYGAQMGGRIAGYAPTLRR